jgi:hypothetical protein
MDHRVKKLYAKNYQNWFIAHCVFAPSLEAIMVAIMAS